MARINEKDVSVPSISPRHIFASVRAPLFAIDVLVAHGPCSSHNRCAIETCWAEMRAMLSTFRLFAVLLVSLTDANGRLGFIQSDVVGLRAPDTQDTAGAEIHRIASEHRLFFSCDF